ncbi:DGQHR domain-containing protein [uncultured Pseudomonas sp.]|uniref:DGQHR domain-containing protein n=1 Tax=uncultured Pseudomonas sp. TaxID=114707 RepID=UPI0025EC993C|nr:DGQHR domain-containing protein [uncultured Pseudomonas sp.]
MAYNQGLPFSESARDKEITVNCIPVEQPLGRFFMASIPHDKLVEITYADTRRVVEEESHGFETMLGIQRHVSPSRIKELNQYVNTFDACFPTSIILSIPEACIEYIEDGNKLRIFAAPPEDEQGNDGIPYEKIAKILDGQHRIKGLEAYNGDKPFDLNVSIFVDLDPASEAYIFSVVNQAQTKVNKSLVYDLYSLAVAKSPQKLCHQVAVALNETDGSPFKNKIKRLGVAGPKTEAVAITQAAFVEALMKHVSYPHARAIEDRDLYLKGKEPARPSPKELEKMIFRGMMIEGRDFELTDVIWNYFEAVQSRWPLAWNSQDKGVMLSKTNGFMALMRFLKDIYIHEECIDTIIPKGRFLGILEGIDLKDSDFTVDNYKPGTSGESALYKDLKAYYQ